jgi:hypothetical protein
MNTKIRTILSISVAVAGLAASTVSYAAPSSIHAPVHAMFSKSQIVTVSLRNDSHSSLELKVGDNVMTLNAGKSITLKLPIGTRILANSSTELHPAGSLIAEVSSSLKDATLAIK